jgi:hypothetical protein
MEHYKSTFATTAIAAFGLLAAAHILHPGNYERTTHPSRPVAAVAPQVSAWVNPPASPAVAPALVQIAGAEAEVGTKPQPVPVAWTSATAQPAEAAPAAEPKRTVAARHRHKVAQRQARIRQAELARPAPPAVQPAAQPQAPQSNRIDPIGDIIRGLGFGRDS